MLRTVYQHAGFSAGIALNVGEFRPWRVLFDVSGRQNKRMQGSPGKKTGSADNFAVTGAPPTGGTGAEAVQASESLRAFLPGLHDVEPDSRVPMIEIEIPNGIRKYRIRTPPASPAIVLKLQRHQIAASNTRAAGRMAGEAEQGRQDEDPASETKSISGRIGIRRYIASAQKPRSTTPIRTCSSVSRAEGNTTFQPFGSARDGSRPSAPIRKETCRRAAERDQAVHRRRVHRGRRPGCRAMPKPSTNKLPSQKVAPEKQIFATSTRSGRNRNRSEADRRR